VIDKSDVPGDGPVLGAARDARLSDGPRPPRYLAGLDLAGRRVVVVGGGTVAARRIPALLEAGALVRLVCPQASVVLVRLAEDGVLEWTVRAYRAGDLDGAWYVLAVTNVPAVNQEVAEAAEAARTFCVRGDRATAGSAVTPALGVRGEVRFGVLGGGDPRRAAAARDVLLGALQDSENRERQSDEAGGQQRNSIPPEP